VRDPVSRDGVEGSPVDGGAQPARRRGRDAEVEARCVAKRAEQAGRIVDEARLVKGHEGSRPKVGTSSKGIEKLVPRGGVQGERHGVHAEVAPRQVILDGSRRNDRQGARVRVPFAPRSRKVDAQVGGHDGGGEKAAMEDGAALELRGAGAGRRLEAVGKKEVEIENRSPGEEIADGPPDQIRRSPEIDRDPDDLAEHARPRSERAVEPFPEWSGLQPAPSPRG
jgi:hypothetical protein